MSTIEVTTQLDTITCYRTDCGILFAVPVHWKATKLRDHKDFWCPNGHPQAYLSKSNEEKLQEELKRTKATVDYLRSDNHRLADDKTRLKHQVRAHKGVATRLRNKAIAGICAFCSCEFPNVAEHVRTDHPGESLEEAPE